MQKQHYTSQLQMSETFFCANTKRLLDSQSITIQICNPLKYLFNMFRSSKSSFNVENVHLLQTQQKAAGVVSWKSTHLSLIYSTWSACLRSGQRRIGMQVTAVFAGAASP